MDVPEFDETIETPEEISDEEIAKFIGIDKASEFHPVLEAWREVLKPIDGEKDARVTPQWATTICGRYREINFADMPEFQRRFYGHLLELRGLVHDEIASDGQCLEASTPQEDAERNSYHYKNLLMQWQLAVMQWEKEWDVTDPHAGVELAAIAEAHRMFFGPQGFTSYLDQIAFEYTEADQQDMADALIAMADE
jgi:hypothetical protein